MKTVERGVYIVLVAIITFACSADDAGKYWMEVVDETSLEVGSCEAQVEYNESLDRYVLNAIGPNLICGIVYVIHNKDKEFMKPYKGEKVIFSGKAKKAELYFGKEKYVGSISTEYYLLDLERIEKKADE